MWGVCSEVGHQHPPHTTHPRSLLRSGRRHVVYASLGQRRLHERLGGLGCDTPRLRHGERVNARPSRRGVAAVPAAPGTGHPAPYAAWRPAGGRSITRALRGCVQLDAGRHAARALHLAQFGLHGLPPRPAARRQPALSARLRPCSELARAQAACGGVRRRLDAVVRRLEVGGTRWAGRQLHVSACVARHERPLLRGRHGGASQ